MNCPRCGAEIAGKGKTPMCQPGAASLSAKKRWPAYARDSSAMGKITSKSVSHVVERARGRNGRPEPSLPRLKFLEKSDHET